MENLNPDLKFCRISNHLVPPSEFFRDKYKKDGLTSSCKTCTRAKNKISYNKNYAKKHDAPQDEQREKAVELDVQQNEENVPLQKDFENMCKKCGVRPRKEKHYKNGWSDTLLKCERCLDLENAKRAIRKEIKQKCFN